MSKKRRLNLDDSLDQDDLLEHDAEQSIDLGSDDDGVSVVVSDVVDSRSSPGKNSLHLSKSLHYLRHFSMKVFSYATVDFAFEDDAIALATSDDENSRQFPGGSPVHSEDESSSQFPQGSQAHSDDEMKTYENSGTFV